MTKIKMTSTITRFRNPHIVSFLLMVVQLFCSHQILPSAMPMSERRNDLHNLTLLLRHPGTYEGEIYLANHAAESSNSS